MGNHATYRYRELSYAKKKDRAAIIRLIGPFAFDPAIRRELGVALTSTENHTWIVVETEQGDVAAFGAVIVRGSNAELVHAYTTESHRGQGIGKELITRRLKMAEEAGCELARTTDLGGKKIYKEMGFTEKQKGKTKYAIYSKELTSNE